MMVPVVEREQFEELVRDSLQHLPREIAERVSNLDVEVHDQASASPLFFGNRGLSLFKARSR